MVRICICNVLAYLFMNLLMCSFVAYLRRMFKRGIYRAFILILVLLIRLLLYCIYKYCVIKLLIVSMIKQYCLIITGDLSMWLFDKYR